MNLPERELNPPEWYAKDIGACSQCNEPMLEVHDEGHHIIACRVCDLGGVADNDRKFSVHFYGIKDNEDLDGRQAPQAQAAEQARPPPGGNGR